MHNKKLYSIKKLLLKALLNLLIAVVFYQQANAQADSIRLNQVGFYTTGPKTAIVLNGKKQKFSIERLDKHVVFTGTLTPSVNPDFTGRKTQIADFSQFSQSGTYIFKVDEAEQSYPFVIEPDAYQKLAAASIKAFYYQRASIPLTEKYAGIWHRPMGHPDTGVIIHPSAASNARPAGTVISSPRGWYDAGDYNKYIVNSGITMGTLLSLYEDFPAYMQSVKLNIPESGNHVPDVLNEALWNLKWMLTMQDPEDGGVYHKLTNASFDGMVMPDQATSKRYVVQKSTAAALEFAAVMAQSSRIFDKFKNVYPGLSDSCIKASVSAWNWAMKNRSVSYDQDALNAQYEPKITTGTYSSRQLGDELVWAACELYVTTGDVSYYHATKLVHDNGINLPSWGQVKLLGFYTLLRYKKMLSGEANEDIAEISNQVLSFCNNLIQNADNNAFKTVIGKDKNDFNWGSNGMAANQGVALVQAYLMTKNVKYLNYALSNLDYLLGRNGTGYCFVTGFGSKSPVHPHHRPSVANGLNKPVPGLLVGGPNYKMQDGMSYPTRVPNQMYLDNDKAYAVNEIAINWNAPFAYLANAIEALKQAF